MKSKLFFGVLIIAVAGLLFHPACKTTESCLYSILGTWNVNLQITFNPWINEVLTFTGSETSGQVLGWAYEAGKTGTYSVTNCTTVQILFNYISFWYGNTNIALNGTLTSNTYMGGNGSWYDDDLGYTDTFPWSATR